MGAKHKGELIFSVTKKDLELEFFRAGGPGGQNQNKTSSGCRIRHRPSGSVVESREHRTQFANKKAAFKKLVDSESMQKWIRKQAAIESQEVVVWWPKGI